MKLNDITVGDVIRGPSGAAYRVMFVDLAPKVGPPHAVIKNELYSQVPEAALSATLTIHQIATDNFTSIVSRDSNDSTTED